MKKARRHRLPSCMGSTQRVLPNVWLSYDRDATPGFELKTNVFASVKAQAALAVSTRADFSACTHQANSSSITAALLLR